jgi:UDP-N-acetyl-D-mannosaminuronic acid dehydrogenase
MADTNKKIVIVGGCGHVGLPLGLVLAEVGHNVIAYDIDQSKVNSVNAGVMPFMENGGTELLSHVLIHKKFAASTDADSIRSAEVLFIVIGTPVDEHLSPDPNKVIDEILKLRTLLNSNQIVLLRSTVFPGVTKKLYEILTEDFPGITVAFTPERIIEGEAIKELYSLPQIIGCYSQEDYTKASAIFESLSIKTLEATPEEAELAKLFTNVWRYIKFATANQFYMMSNNLSVDYGKVRNAISFEYPRAMDIPGAGFTAGPCLFKDTMQLSSLVQHNFPLGTAAMMINEGMPNYLVSRLSLIYDLKELNVGILGMAFKAEVDDTRSSLAYKLRKLLNFSAKKVFATDPYVKDQSFSNLDEVLIESDLLIIAAPHNQYRSIKTDKPVVDIWGLLGRSLIL